SASPMTTKKTPRTRIDVRVSPSRITADYNEPMMRYPVTQPRTHGFTLIEILVVIVILGVLAALVVPRVIERPDEARVVAAKTDIATIMQALKLYRLDNQRYPTTEQGLSALVAKPEQPPVPPHRKPGGPGGCPGLATSALRPCA